MYYSTNNDICQIELQAMMRVFSEPRVERYVTAFGKSEAAEKYIENIHLSSALFAVIGVFEIELRNFVLAALEKNLGDRWQELEMMIPYAKSRLSECNEIAELTFSFWIHFFEQGPNGAYQDRMWKAILYPEMAHAKLSYRKQIHKILKRIRQFRNRIAHHEPVIFGVKMRDENLIMSYSELISDIIEVSGYISDDFRTVVESVASVNFEAEVACEL